MIDYEIVVLRYQSVIQRYEDDADLAGCVKAFEKKVRIRTEDANAVTLWNSAYVMRRSASTMATFDG